MFLLAVNKLNDVYECIKCSTAIFVVNSEKLLRTITTTCYIDGRGVLLGLIRKKQKFRLKEILSWHKINYLQVSNSVNSDV